MIIHCVWTPFVVGAMELLHQRQSWSSEADQAARHTTLARREVVLLGLPSDEPPALHDTGDFRPVYRARPPTLDNGGDTVR